MKSLNKKGFTLIELLAVIVILALLVAVAVPAVTRYLNTARAGVFANDAATAISAVRNEVMAKSLLTSDKDSDDGKTDGKVTKYYKIEDINNNLLESSKTIDKSPYGPGYDKANSFVKVIYDKITGKYEYCIHLTDGVHGISQKDETKVVSSNVVTIDKFVANEKCEKDEALQGNF